VRKMQALLVVLVVGGLGYLGYRWWEVERLASRYDEAAEIAKSSITKEGATWTVRMESVIAEPIDEVWQALRAPQRSAELMPETFHRSEVKKEDGAKKTVEFRVQLLSLPAQTMVADLHYDDASKRMTLTTSGGIQKIDGAYELESLSAEKTRLVYHATAVDRVSLPIPQSAMEGALREFFVMQVRALKKATGAAPAGPAKAEVKEQGPKVGSICTGEAGTQGIKQVTITIAPADGAAPAIEVGSRRDTTDGYERAYAVGDVPVLETFDLETRCTTADAFAGPFRVRVQSVILSPDGLSAQWVERVDLDALARLDSGAGAAKLASALPEPERGWNVVSPVDPPPLEAPVVHRAYQQAFF
jgi:carbon monoxide dehydrogenase subunit G